MLEYHLIEGPGEPAGHLDPARLKHQYAILRDLQIIAADLDYQQAFTTEFTSPR
jgi:hypothetical protein